nr:MAG TPA: hypothetical protein [Caudoviricetes sp.]
MIFCLVKAACVFFIAAVLWPVYFVYITQSLLICPCAGEVEYDY